jgi:hypothetical protein
MAPMTLYYFELPGRGETARLLLTIGGVEFIVSARSRCVCARGTRCVHTPLQLLPVARLTSVLSLLVKRIVVCKVRVVEDALLPPLQMSVPYPWMHLAWVRRAAMLVCPV